MALGQVTLVATCRAPSLGVRCDHSNGDGEFRLGNIKHALSIEFQTHYDFPFSFCIMVLNSFEKLDESTRNALFIKILSK